MSNAIASSRSDATLSSLTARLLTLAPYVGLENPRQLADRGCGALMFEVASAVRADGSYATMWLALAVISGSFPTSSEVLAASRALALADPNLLHRSLMQSVFKSPRGLSRLNVPVEIVSDATIVDVDFCATFMHNTGIQRVVRQTMRRWDSQHDVLLAGWNHLGYAMRRLTASEKRRVVDWPSSSSEDTDDPSTMSIVVPYRSHVVIPEVPQAAFCPALAGLAEFSNNSVSLVGYDTIPILSADTLQGWEADRFSAYLTVVKHSDTVAGISAAATREFAGFVAALGAQGITGPSTVQVQLPVEVPDRSALGEVEPPGQVSVLCVGSQEPRKNQLSVLFAAEVLWREGLDFSLTFIGGGSRWFTRVFDAKVKRVRRQGRQVFVRRGVSDTDMFSAYRQALFTVFPSLHEGYGLPVAESLAFGVPVITTNYGSTAEIAKDGGCVVVDPRNDESLVAAMRSLLTDPARRETLVSEIAARPARSWDDYAADLWTAFRGKAD